MSRIHKELRDDSQEPRTGLHVTRQDGEIVEVARWTDIGGGVCRTGDGQPFRVTDVRAEVPIWERGKDEAGGMETGG